MGWLRRIILLALIVGLVLASHFFVQNHEQTVALDLAAVRYEAVPLWLVLLSAFGLGLAAAMAIAVLRGARLRLVARRYRKQAESLEAEVHELRTLPLAPEAPGAAPAADAAPDDGLERGT